MDEFATVLRAWRDRVSPAEVGLAAGSARRAPGLRREELAGLAGLSVEYLVRLEQGRARHPSPQMLGALARALRLSDDERDHLYRVAGAAAPSPGTVSQHISAGVQRVIDRLADVPLGVFSAAWDLLWWNPLWAALTGDPSARRGLDRNVAWRHFTEPRTVIDFDDQHAEEFSRDLAADLREALGRYPDDPDLQTLIRRLQDELAAVPAVLGRGAHRAAPGEHQDRDVDRRWDRSGSTATCSPRPALTCGSSSTPRCRGRRTPPGSRCWPSRARSRSTSV